MQAWKGAIFLVYSAETPKGVAIIHDGEPLRVDDVVINPDNDSEFFVDPYHFALAEPRGEMIEALIPYLRRVSPGNRLITIPLEPEWLSCEGST